ncbi:RND transporter [Ruminococcus flavefaciens]|uniref:Membrane fusion protein biotin-lipoyl like domain-containing protein n=1 Tax=Ruminococcus flavefaciens 007c TaxID=1341157 RepID=W7UML5_RUMFL|nr:RND transporter [Ruminococcus flavefaciens]EWM52794.1 hypothetical protein RF007C_14345 [Ruminococcus flavefaciens 007c]
MNESKELKEILAEDDEKEKKSPAKKRELIKTLIIIFLAVMLILTFFSNTIMNKSLPEITTETVSSGKLTERIRKDGTVESNQAYDVMIDGNRTVEKIHIKLGQEVKKNDVLFTVSAVDSDTLEAEEKSLDELKLAYETALLKEPLDYSKEDQAIKAARAELNEAIAKRDAARNNSGNAAYEKEQYNRNKNELTRLTALQTKLEDTIKAIDSDSYSEAAPEFSGDLASLCSEFNAAEQEYETANSLLKVAMETGNGIEEARADSDAKEAVRNEKRDAYNNAKNSIRGDLISRLSDVSNSVNDLTNAVNSYSSDSGEGGTSDSYETLAAAVTEKQNALEVLIIELNKTKRTDSITNQKEALDLESKKKAVDKQKEKVDKLKKEAKATEIKSKYSGIVSAINVQPDDKTTEGNPAATIDLADEGYTVSIFVEPEKAKKVKKGAEADIVNNWNGDITAVLKEIKNDNSNGSRQKKLIFSVSGDVKSGERIDLSVPCGGGNYDAIVPKSAVKQDTEGYYVYTVRSKSTPLGNRYYADKVTVEVAASDDVSSAVIGNISRGDYVITAGSKVFGAGDQVRLKDK